MPDRRLQLGDGVLLVLVATLCSFGLGNNGSRGPSGVEMPQRLGGPRTRISCRAGGGRLTGGFRTSNEPDRFGPIADL